MTSTSELVLPTPVTSTPGVETRLMRAQLEAQLFEREAAPVRIGRFEVLQRLGAGGMGVVWAAHDPQLDRRVAIKLLRAGVGVPTEALLREARALARLSHAHVVAVFEVGTVDDAVFLAMEYLDGGTLADWLRAHPLRGRGDVARVLAPLLAAGRGLVAAHEAGLVHHDFKPANVLRGLDGRVKVADFGLARARVDDTAQPGGGATAAVGGTPAYMAPEQFAGEADARSDQFAFCVAVWEALAGRRPHETTAADRGTNLPEPPREIRVPSGIWRALQRGLAGRPEDRWPTMAALLDALDAALRRGRRRRWIAGGAVTTAFVAALWRPWEIDDPCPTAASAFGEAWDDDRRADLTAAFEGLGRAYLVDTAARVLPLLDDFAARWSTVRHSACEAALVRRERAPVAYDVTLRCLDRLRRGLDNVVGQSIAADEDRAAKVLDAVLALPAPETCEDAQDDRATWPADPTQRQRVEILAAQVDAIEAAEPLGDDLGQLAAIEAILPELAGLGQTRLVARAGRLACRAEVALEEFIAAEQRCRDALEAAAIAGDDRLVASLWIDLHRVIDGGVGDAGLSLELGAQTALARAGNLVGQRIALTRERGAMLARAGRPNEALDVLRQAEQLATTEGTAADARELAVVRGFVASAIGVKGETATARALLEESLVSLADMIGDRHPDAARMRVNLAALCLRLGDLEEAYELYELAAMDLEAAYGEGTAFARASLGVALAMSNLGDFDGALRLAREAMVLFDDTPQSDRRGYFYALSRFATLLGLAGASEEAAEAHEAVIAGFAEHRDKALLVTDSTNAGSLRRVLGELDAARAHLQRAFDVMDETFGSDAPALWQPLFRLGQVELAANRFSEAATHLDRAASILAVHPVRPSLMAEVELDRASAYAGLGDRARALAGLDRATILAREAVNDVLLEEIAQTRERVLRRR
jgi:tetratricopeptide (TPR) repeat protein